MTFDVDQLITGSPRKVERQPQTGRVVRVDADGAPYVAPLGGDTRAPIGPCRGIPADVGDVVLLVWTQERPWVAQRDGV